MNITHRDDGKKGGFSAANGEETYGQMTYVWVSSNKIIIDHTDVSPLHKGKGVGRELLMETVEFARRKNLKIMPLCPFAAAMFRKMPEIGDVLE